MKSGDQSRGKVEGSRVPKIKMMISDILWNEGKSKGRQEEDRFSSVTGSTEKNRQFRW